jgi:hypothetical protein
VTRAPRLGLLGDRVASRSSRGAPFVRGRASLRSTGRIQSRRPLPVALCESRPVSPGCSLSSVKFFKRRLAALAGLRFVLGLDQHIAGQFRHVEHGRRRSGDVTVDQLVGRSGGGVHDWANARLPV